MAPFLVGIDLGTTHSALAFLRPEGGAQAAIEDFLTPQRVRPTEVEARPLLPSFVYLPAGPELPAGAEAYPWESRAGRITGELARWQGARVPTRLVGSAKSWLCHPGVDRQAPILPWGAPPDVPKLSPVEASAEVLSHLVRAWDQAHPNAPLHAQEVVLTVPASFDEAARALTVTAARRAGLERFLLLEEPQAAFYDFTARHRTELTRALAGVRLVLVVDVGGGTTDFTLVHAGMSPEGPLLRRIAVGDHLLLGGDNMDAALAHAVETQLGSGQRLPASQWLPLAQKARLAKETLLGATPPERERLTVAGEGSRLLGSARTVELTRDEVETVVLDGFFPRVSPQDRPRSNSGKVALQALGLPYAQDPAITRHLTAFLAAHAPAAFAALGENAGRLPRPDAILLNGGVFNSPRIAARLLDSVSALFPDRPPIPLLPHESLERAVARGAAYYALVRGGMGLKMGGGAARAFYLGVRGEGGASQVVCLTPRGFEEGSHARLKQTFALRLGEPVQFPLFSTSADRIDTPGDVVPPDESFRPLPPLHTVLASARTTKGEVPVQVEAALTEIGTLELALVQSGESRGQDERWRLEFELRGARERARLTRVESMPARFQEAREWVERIFGHKPIPKNPKDVKQLFRALEKVLGPREEWGLPVLRELWSALYAGAAKRRRSPDHERVFFQLLGFTLRPGLGYPLDDWRAEQCFRLFADKVQFHTEKANWVEFWVLWRRVSGGLASGAQAEIWDFLRPVIWRKLSPDTGGPKTKGIQPEGLDEMIRTAAALEHLPAAEKETLGGWIARKLRAEPRSGGPWAWSLGRLGTRAPLYGSGHQTVPAEVAQDWLTLLLDVGLERLDGAPFAAAFLARMTGDRTRDLDEDLRGRTLEALRRLKAPGRWVGMVEEVVTLDAEDEARALGDTLPAGLSL